MLKFIKWVCDECKSNKAETENEGVCSCGSWVRITCLDCGDTNAELDGWDDMYWDDKTEPNQLMVMK